MRRTDLTDGWTLRPVSGPIPEGIPGAVPATVPGTVHTDLLAAGLIPDPYLDRNEAELGWIGESDFAYDVRFESDLAEFERIDLVAEGLDTVATIDLNGVRVGSTKNQHRSYRFDVTEAVRATGNELTVGFQSALAFARGAEKRIGERPFVGNALPYNAIRKMASNFGWDWGPVLVTAGIWKPLSLQGWSVARLAQVLPEVRVGSDGVGRVTVRVDLERTSTTAVDVEARLTGPGGVDLLVSQTGSESGIVLELEVPDAALWWPRGYGEQPLYALEVRVSQDGRELDAWTREIGFRTVELRMEPDAFGTSFRFFVNGEYVWIKGANWIPDDCFPHRVGPDDYARGVADAVDADMNLLRIWGGGLFESDHLYERCNREGILVWQDFLFACAAYSEADELRDEVEAESRENIVRLAPHPSLAFWNGSNENIEGYYEWGWRDALGEGVSWGRGYYDELLPALVAELDPARSYTPSSPFSPKDYSDPRDPDNGSVHSWEVWNRKDYTAYRDSIPRFVAEFGFQGPPAMATITESIHDVPLLPDSPGILAHQKAEDGNGKLQRGYQLHLPEPAHFDDWHYATQLNQARAIQFGIEHFRSHSPRTAGTIVWQLNDCWPVTSWAAVDSRRRRKPLWYALRNVNAPHLITLQPRPDGLSLVASNDSGVDWAAEIQVARRTLDGAAVVSRTIHLTVPARRAETILLDASLVVPLDERREFVQATTAEARPAFWYFVEDVELDLAEPTLSAEVRAEAGGVAVELRAATLIKDIVLNVDRLDPRATVDDALVTLLPGESHTFHIRSDVDLDGERLVSHPVLQSVNALVANRLVTEGTK
ncbi:beta-mannosidase [Frondihabitans sucicola]|uniref:beta-mannosidase n=1 Tax=Frondihabitans sucicola TaxID=1268041 RepID=A0ABN6XUV0_9MICO|nr:glycoside hydrolase family 2 protein [Frondihabitans sucicola]BDZ48731.1 beta-mannosidase [Frondihabitans sucicola]